jgi:hypothetical protein
MTAKSDLNPDNDGVTHINVYSQGKTWLGRELSNFAHRPFCHDEHGLFASVEGYWYWLGRQDERLRHLYGFKAKELGRSLPIVKNWHSEKFQSLICQALSAKLDRHPDIQKVLIESTLPLEHYYAKYYGDTLKVTQPANSDWILAHLEKVRHTHNPEADTQHMDKLAKRKELAANPPESASQLGLF